MSVCFGSQRIRAKRSVLSLVALVAASLMAGASWGQSLTTSEMLATQAPTSAELSLGDAISDVSSDAAITIDEAYQPNAAETWLESVAPDSPDYFEPSAAGPDSASFEVWQDALQQQEASDESTASVVPEPAGALLFAALVSMFAALMLLRRRFDISSAA